MAEPLKGGGASGVRRRRAAAATRSSHFIAEGGQSQGQFTDGQLASSGRLSADRVCVKAKAGLATARTTSH